MATKPLSAVSEYLELPYEITVVRRDGEEGTGWTAQVQELACEGRGRTEAEALKGVRTAMADRIADALANDRPVPPPRAATSHSGRLLVRMPQSLHADLARLADREGVSLNAFIVGVLGGATAWRQPAPPPGSRVRSTPPPGGPAKAAPADSAPPVAGNRPDRAGLITTALRVNIVVVAIVGLVAVALLLAALAA